MVEKDIDEDQGALQSGSLNLGRVRVRVRVREGKG